jgi:hypothetical protein
MSFSEICDLFVDITETAAHNQIAFLRDTIQSLRNLERDTLLLDRVTVDTPVYFDVAELRRLVDNENERMVPGQAKPIKGPLFGTFDRMRAHQQRERELFDSARQQTKRCPL